MKTRLPTAVDLFAGCGGLSLGLRRAGLDVKIAVEIDSDAAETYRLNHPEVRIIQQDIREIDLLVELNNMNIGRGELDLLAACPPCQGFSTMRTLNGQSIVEDDRNDLVLTVEKIVTKILPRSVLLENVPGLANDRRFTRLVETLSQLGYFSDWHIEDAADYGVPQNRRRLILLASRVGMLLPNARKSAPRSVRSAIGTLPKPSASSDPLHNIRERRSKRVQQIIAAIPKDGGSRSDLPDSLKLECHRKTTGFKDVYGRLSWDQPSNTITSGCTNPSKGRFIHPEQNRALTLREAAILQGFPRSYKFPNHQTKSALALQIGNAIPPAFAKAHASRLPI